MAEAGKFEADRLRRLLHDCNQPLTAIGNYAQAGCQLIDQGLSDPARLRQLFEKIAQQGDRASALTRELGQALANAGATQFPR
jgi:C4-dicarboxylate-specific signal transduction histidine kinase